jgi:hypothetical protein
MTWSVQGVRSPVKREGAERYILISLVSFAASVIFTRLFLQVTGYPQLGGGELHIAHVLWGGLLLFVASVLPLILANRWAFNTSAILSGVGVGLFIDEVGKFITQNNDYFYPPAAPIIYAFFLLTVLLYLRVRRPPPTTPRGELYRIFEGLTEVLDHDLDPDERASLESRLMRIAGESDDRNLKRLAHALVDYLEAEQLHLVEPRSPALHRVGLGFNHIIQAHLTRPRLKAFLVVSLGAMGVLALIELILLLWAIPAPEPVLEAFLTPLVTRGEIRSANDAAWFLARTVLEGGTGLLLIAAGGLMAAGRERRGVRLATYIMIVWLTIVNLLVFYLDQFGAVVATLFQFLVLLALIYYRSKYLGHHHPKEPPASV